MIVSVTNCFLRGFMDFLIVVIICLALTAVTYKTWSKRCISRGKGRTSTVITSLLLSFVVLTVTFVIGVISFIPAKSGAVSTVTESMPSEREQKAKRYIESKINSLNRSSGKYLVAENIYKQHGVWVDDYIAIQKKSCSREFNRLLAANAASEQAIEYWNQTSDSLTRSGVSPFAGGRNPTTDPEIQRTRNDIDFARSQLDKCGVAHLNEIEHRVTVQIDN